MKTWFLYYDCLQKISLNQTLRPKRFTNERILVGIKFDILKMQIWRTFRPSDTFLSYRDYTWVYESTRILHFKSIFPFWRLSKRKLIFRVKIDISWLISLMKIEIPSILSICLIFNFFFCWKLIKIIKISNTTGTSPGSPPRSAGPVNTY